MEPRRARRRRRLPGAASRALRRRRRAGRRARAAGRPAAGLRPRPLRGATRRSCSRTSRARSCDAYVDANARRCEPCCRPTSSSRTTCCSAEPSARRRGRAGSRSRRTAPSSSTRCAATPELAALGRGVARGRRRRLRRLGAHPRGARGRRRARRPRARGAARRRRRRVPARAAGPRRWPRCSTRRGVTAESGTATSASPTRATRERLDAFFAGETPTVLYFGKLLDNKGVHVLFEALREHRRARRGRRLRRLPAPARGARAARARSSPGRSSTAISCTCSRSSTSPSSPRSSPRRSAWSPPRPPPPACRRSSRATPASPRSPAGSRPSIPPQLAQLVAFPTGDVARPRSERLRELLALPAERAAPRSASRRARAVERAAGAGRASPSGCSRRFASRRSAYPSAWVTSRSSRSEELLASRARAVRGGARLHPRRRGGVRAPRPGRRSASSTASRSSRRRRGARELEPHLVGELIASEVEVRTGRCETFAEAAARHRRAPRPAARARRRRSASRSPRVGTHPVEPVAGPADHRHAALPPQRRAPPLRRLAQQHLRPPRPRRRSTAPTARSRVCNALRDYLPELLALSASSPFVEGVVHGPPLGAHADLHAHVPALRHPRRVRRLGRVRALRPLPLRDAARSPSTRSSGGACGRTSRSRRSRSASATRSPTSAEAQLARRALLRARRADRARARRGRAAPDLPHRLIEENLWRAIRYGLSGELIDLERRESVPARAAPRAAHRVGAAGRRGARRRARGSPCPRANAAERQIARHEEGATIEEIFAEQVGAHLRAAAG